MSKLIQGVYPSRDPEFLESIAAFLWWDKAVPPRVAKNARPVRLQKGVLTIHCATSAWANDLEFLKTQLLQSVKRRAPSAGVKDIRIRVGPLPKVTLRAAANLVAPRIPLASLPEDLARALAGVKNNELRDAIKEAARVALAPPTKKSTSPSRTGG